MIYPCVYPVDIGSGVADFIFAGADSNGNLIEEPQDRGLRVAAVTESIRIESSFDGQYDKTEINDDIEVSVYITNSRIAFHCRNYDTGGAKWVGFGVAAMGVSAILNAAQKSKAAKRTAGKVLVGHIRYEWLTRVAFMKKTSWLTMDSIELYYKDSDNINWEVSLDFPKGTNVESIASQILYNAFEAKRALNMCSLEDTRVFAQVPVGNTTVYIIEPEFPAVPAPEQVVSHSAQIIEHAPEEPQTIVARFCKKCGADLAPINKDIRFCPKCGTQV